MPMRLAARPSHRFAVTDPHPGMLCWMCKTAACGCEHPMHDNRCLPGEGREVKDLAPQMPEGLACRAHAQHP
jgi:hypothetical protein